MRLNKVKNIHKRSFSIFSLELALTHIAYSIISLKVPLHLRSYFTTHSTVRTVCTDIIVFGLLSKRYQSLTHVCLIK